MSYVLHVWEKPAPASVEDAHRFIFEQDKESIGPSAKFAAFVKALLAAYPDSATLKATGHDPGDTVWSDLTLASEADGPVYVVGLSTPRMDDIVVPFIAHTAADHGLYVYDMQGDMLVRPDRTLLLRDGTVAGLPDKRLPARKPPSRPKVTLTPKACEDVITARVAQALGSRGWREHPRSPHAAPRLARAHGDIGQVLIFGGVEWTTGCSVRLQVGLYAEPVHRLHRAFFPDLHAQWDKLSLPLLSNIVFDACGLLATTPEWLDTRLMLTSRQAAATWASLFPERYLAQLAPKLDACTDLSGCHRLILDGHRHASEAWHPYTATSGLLFAHCAKAPEEAVAYWVDVLRQAQAREYGAMVSQYRDDPGAFGGQVPFKVAESGRIDRIVETVVAEGRAG